MEGVERQRTESTEDPKKGRGPRNAGSSSHGARERAGITGIESVFREVEAEPSYRGVGNQTAEWRVPGALLRAGGPSEAGSPAPRRRGAPDALNSRVAARPRRASPRLAQSILLRCRSRPGSGYPCPAGGGTQARSTARGSPGERRAGSILPGSHGPRVRVEGGDRHPRGPASSRGPRPAGPRTRPAPSGAAHLLAPRPPPPPGSALLAPASRLQLPPGRSLRSLSALRELSRAAVATRRWKNERASERGRRGLQSRLWSPCALSPSWRGSGRDKPRARGPRPSLASVKRESLLCGIPVSRGLNAGGERSLENQIKSIMCRFALHTNHPAGPRCRKGKQEASNPSLKSLPLLFWGLHFCFPAV
ncbi:uncharacterized protein [Macaca fascicularis]|uniref:uncharacterized protein n=1 Tax=Macaca fascicularis TaxID=9541 RepID=UPI003D15E3E2